MASIGQNILGAIQERLETVAGLPGVSYEGVKFKPAVGVPFIETTMLWGARRQTTMGDNGMFYHQGIYMVMLVYPFGRGTGALTAMADAIVAVFNPTDVLTLNAYNIRILFSEKQGPPMEQADWIRQRVAIGWHLFANE